MNSLDYTLYSKTYESILSQEKFIEKSNDFDVSIEIAQIEEGKNLYYVIIDSPKVSMFDVEVMVVEEGVDGKKNMFPTIGILEDQSYNLIPSQINAEEGFVKGVILNGETKNNQTLLRIMVSWTNSAGSERVKEFLQIEVEVE